MTSIQRWYDKNPAVSEMFKVLRSMSEKEQEKFAFYLYQIVNDSWKRKKFHEESLSLGREKLFNYYKSYQKRRWYDKCPSLRSAALVMSLMETEEMESVVHIFYRTLKKEGLESLFNAKKTELNI